MLGPTSLVLLCAAVVSALPNDGYYPSPVDSARRFKIHSHSITYPKHFDNLILDAYHIPPGQGFCTTELIPRTKDNGIPVHLNGTKTELAHRQGSLVRTEPTSPDLAQVFMIGLDNFPSKQYATSFPISAFGAGTKGIYVEGGLLKYNEPGSQGWYACNTTIYNAFFGVNIGPFVRLFWKQAKFKTPKDCEDVKLQVKYVKDV